MVGEMGAFCGLSEQDCVTERMHRAPLVETMLCAPLSKGHTMLTLRRKKKQPATLLERVQLDLRNGVQIALERGDGARSSAQRASEKALKKGRVQGRRLSKRSRTKKVPVWQVGAAAVAGVIVSSLGRGIIHRLAGADQLEQQSVRDGAGSSSASSQAEERGYTEQGLSVGPVAPPTAVSSVNKKEG